MPPPPPVEHCYRHPTVPTAVHCTRCGKPICPDCMVPAPVGHHCPDCVAAARREFRQGPGRRIAVANAKAISVTSALLAAIVGMYVVEIAVGGPGSLFTGPSTTQLVRLGAAVPVYPTATGVVGLVEGQYWRLFTAMFLHAGLLHIAFNAYALWIFGTMMEEEMGRLRFLVTYLLTGLFGGAFSYAFATFSTQGGQLVLPAASVGASGAIFGIFGAFVAFNWGRRHTALGAARLRMALVLILLNAFIGLGSGGAIDWHAHLGGFIGGLVLGFALEGFGRLRNTNVVFAATCVVLAGLTAALALYQTNAILQRFPSLG